MPVDKSSSTCCHLITDDRWNDRNLRGAKGKIMLSECVFGGLASPVPPWAQISHIKAEGSAAVSPLSLWFELTCEFRP